MPHVVTKRPKTGWTTVAFGDVVHQVKDKVDPEQSGLERYVAGEHMDTDDLRIRRWGEIGDGYLGPAFHMRFKPGHVLYGSRRTYLRKVAVADFEGITANTTYVVESADPTVLLPELLPFIMQTEEFRQHSVRESKGSVNPYVNFSDLAWFQFALPPIDEQRRIVQVLQAVEDAQNSLYSARRAAEQLCVSIVDEWLGCLSSHGVPPTPLGELALDKPSYGLNAPGTEFDPGLPRYLRITDIDDAGGLNHQDVVSVNVDDPEPYRIGSGDLLFARTGNTVGKAYLASGLEGDVVYAGYLIRFRIDARKVDPKYVFACTRSTSYRRWVVGKCRVGAQPNINASEYCELPIHLPRERVMQSALVDRVTEALDAIKNLETRRAEVREFKGRFVDRVLVGANPHV